MSATMITIQEERVAPISRLWWVGLVAAGAAALGNVVFYFLAQALGVSFLMPAGPESTELEILPVAVVAMASAVPAVIATLVYGLMGRFLARPIRAFWILSAIVFVIWSILPFVMLPESVATSTVVALELMHVIAAVAIVGILTTWGRQQ